MKKLIAIATAILVTLAICVWLSSAPKGGTTYPIIFAAPASAIMTFFGLIAVLTDTTRNDSISDSTMRSALTGALVIMYIVVVGFGVFTSEGYGGMSPIAQSLMTSFTSVVGIAVAFYFGSSAYVQVNKPKGEKDEG